MPQVPPRIAAEYAESAASRLNGVTGQSTGAATFSKAGSAPDVPVNLRGLQAVRADRTGASRAEAIRH